MKSNNAIVEQVRRLMNAAKKIQHTFGTTRKDIEDYITSERPFFQELFDIEAKVSGVDKKLAKVIGVYYTRPLVGLRPRDREDRKPIKIELEAKVL